jgi:uncharacterized membrane protein HdeD (DUF308 family)
MEHTKRAWPWLVGIGVLLMLTGFMALGSELVAGMLTILLVGWLLTIGGVVELYQAFNLRGTNGFAPVLLGGIISFFAGAVILMRPAMSADALIILLGAYFVAGGAFKLVTAFMQRRDAWGWIAFGGLVDLLLGLLLWNAWMGQSLALIGIFVGITLIFRGIPWIMIGLALRKLPA